MDFSLSHKLNRVAQGAARIILDAKRNMAVDQKAGHGNFVTEYDVKVQKYIKSHLLEIMPDAKFIGEEDIEQSELPMGYCFIVDPIDGTCNFMYDYKCSAISIALLYDKQVVAGVICNPYTNEYFSAELGKQQHGADCGGHPRQGRPCRALVPSTPDTWGHSRGGRAAGRHHGRQDS